MKAIRNFLDKIDPELMIQESMYGLMANTPLHVMVLMSA